MTNDGMLAKNYSAWIDLDITLDPTTKLLVENYVIGSPAFGLSQKGRDLYTYYHFKTKKNTYNCGKICARIYLIVIARITMVI